MNTNDILTYYSKNDMQKLKALCYPIISKIGGLSDMDYDDFYSIANMTLWKATEVFDENCHDNFEVFLKGCLERKFLTELTRRNRKRRINPSEIDRLDKYLDEEGETTLVDLIKSDFDLDENIEDLNEDLRVINYISSLSKKQRKIAMLILEGYELHDIKIKLGFDSGTFNSLVNKMRTFDKRIMLKRYED